jgi:hypothetical protein
VTVEVTEFSNPFRHWVLPRPVPVRLLQDARFSVPAADRPEWVRYDNELERRKWTMEDRDAMGAGWSTLLERLDGLAADLSALTGVAGLRADPSRRGAGLHLMFPGAALACHVDYALAPCGLERRVNLILFVDGADSKGGGGLQLCDPLGQPAKTLHPHAGVAVVWECGDETYHAVEPLAADSPPRVTAAAYYLAAPRPNCTRRRALFLPRR